MVGFKSQITTPARTACKVAFANLLLRVEGSLDSWAVRIFDLSGREMLYEAMATTVAEAKALAVDFAFKRLFGAGHTKDTRAVAESLAWESA